ncbi:hypothetical protein AX15_007920 [Amanita polypyramis BW_CC]|nr:hypothetical protein AX15_007920 [Amanita polypyramis BW_CC]
MVGGKAAGSIGLTIPKSGYFAKAGPRLQMSLFNSHAIYFGVALVPAGLNVILGAITLGLLNRIVADGRRMVLHTILMMVVSFIVFVALCTLLWLSRGLPVSSVHPISHLLQSLLIAIIFFVNGLIVVIDLPENCNAKAAADGASLGLAPCVLLTSMSVLSFLPVIPSGCSDQCAPFY